MDGKNKAVLVDSNIVIYSAELEYQSVAHWLRARDIYISDISKIEILGFSNLLGEDKLYFEKFFSKCGSFPIDEKVISEAISIRQKKKISLGDAIIAATAVVQELPLITANTKDFKHIKKLELINPLML